MKNVVLGIVLIVFAITSVQAQVGIGTTDPSQNTMLEIFSDSKGLLIPRLTTEQRNENLADNDPDTIYPDNLPVLDPIPNPEDYLKEGTLYYNTEFKKYQYWDANALRWVSLMDIKGFASGNDGSVLINFPEYNDAAAVKYNLNSSLQYEYEWTVTRTDYTLGIPQTQSDYTFLLSESVFGPQVIADFDEDDFDIADPPVTRWPENATNTTKSGIWDEVNHTILENPIEGQVHFWRIVIEYEVPNGNSQKGSIEASITNPNVLSTFSTSNTTSVIDGQGGAIIKSTFLFLSVSDSFSLPSSTSGGLGYNIGFRANTDVTISLRSILRVSIFTD